MFISMTFFLRWLLHLRVKNWLGDLRGRLFLQPSKTNSLQRLVGQTGLSPTRAVGSRHVAGVVSLSTVAVLAGTGGKTQTRARLTRRTMTAKRRPTLCGENVCLPRARGQDSGRDDCTDFGRIRNPSEPELTGGCRWWWWLMARLKDGLLATLWNCFILRNF